VLLASVSVVTLRIKYVAAVEFVCVLRKYVRILCMRQVVLWAGSDLDLEYEHLKIITDCLLAQVELSQAKPLNSELAIFYEIVKGNIIQLS
jgi:hypothetical protein